MDLIERYNKAKSEYDEADTIILEMIMADKDFIEIEAKEIELETDKKYKEYYTTEIELQNAIFEAIKKHDKCLYDEFKNIEQDQVMITLFREKIIEVGINLLKK